MGPAVRHGDLSFCFVYKFRQRFGIVADAIAKGLGRETAAAVDAARDMNMYLDDFECCKAACGEACYECPPPPSLVIFACERAEGCGLIM